MTAEQDDQKHKPLRNPRVDAIGNAGDRDRPDDQPPQPIGRTAAGRAEHEQRRALQHEQCRQRHHDIRHARHDDQYAVDRAEHQPHRQHEGHDEQRIFLARAVHHGGRRHAGQRHHRRDGKVDAAGEDDDGLRRDRKGVRQHRAHQRSEIARSVARLDDPGEDEQDDEQDEETDDPAVLAEKAHHGAATEAGCTPASMPTSALASRGRP